MRPRSQPAIASIRVSDIGMDAVILVVIATTRSTTSRRSVPLWFVQDLLQAICVCLA